MSYTDDDVTEALNAAAGIDYERERMEAGIAAVAPQIAARTKVSTLRMVAAHLRNAHEDDEASRCILEWAENEREHNAQVNP